MKGNKEQKISPTNYFHYMVWFQKTQILKKNPLDTNWKSISINVCFTSTNKIKLYRIMYFLRATTHLLCCVFFLVHLHFKKQIVEQNFSMFLS